MTETQKSETNTTPIQESTVIVRVPKPNLQVVVLGLIALITLFQTFQLMRISAKAGTGTDSDVPESMVGGC